MPEIQLTPDLIEGFAGIFLSPSYDQPQPTPPFHRKGWALYCSPIRQAAVAAPRGHAKSTAFTHDFILASCLFRIEQYVVLVSSTEEMAIEHLGDIARELRENEELRAHFGVVELSTDAKTDIVCLMQDGHQFRVIARGSGQKMRGRKWHGRRPGLIVCDDLEDDEQVESKDRREKFRRWFFRALKPALRDGGKIRVHGTILHIDSLLSRLMKDDTWKTQLYRAHKSFSDFSGILWPEKFTEKTLRAIRQTYVAQGDGPGYSQEYLNEPLDQTNMYFQRDWFLPIQLPQLEYPARIYVGGDFAVSKSDNANHTAFTVCKRTAANQILFIDQYRGRWDTLEWINILFEIQETYSPEAFFVEDGVIWKSMARTVANEMQERNIWLNIIPIPSVKDKATRARPLQKRMRAGNCFFAVDAPWYADYFEELTRFTGYSEAISDDQVDSSSILIRGLEESPVVESEDFLTEDEWMERWHQAALRDGRSKITGY